MQPLALSSRPKSHRCGHRCQSGVRDPARMWLGAGRRIWRRWGVSRWNRWFLSGMLNLMSDVTRIISQIEQGDPSVAEQLLPLVYDELRRLAARQLANEKPGQTLQPTALVHEAYLRLLGNEPISWNSRGHFFGAAAEAMRRILVEQARRKKSQKRGGGLDRIQLRDDLVAEDPQFDNILALEEALSRLEQEDAKKAQLVKLRFFAGLTIEQAAVAMNISNATADRWWTYARARMQRDMKSSEPHRD